MVRCGYMWLVEVRSGIDVVYRWYSGLEYYRVARGVHSTLSIALYCTSYTVQCTVYIVQCILYNVHCTLYIVYCTL